MPAGRGLEVAFNRMIAVVNGHGILVSDDAGVSWTFASAQFIRGARRVELAHVPLTPNIAYAAVEGGVADLLRSDDGGMSWVPSIDLSVDPVTWLAGQGWYDNALGVHPFEPDRLFVGVLFLYKARMEGGVAVIEANFPSSFDLGGTEFWMGLVPFGGSAGGATLDFLSPDVVNISVEDYPSTVEYCFGQGSQKGIDLL